MCSSLPGAVGIAPQKHSWGDDPEGPVPPGGSPRHDGNGKPGGQVGGTRRTLGPPPKSSPRAGSRDGLRNTRSFKFLLPLAPPWPGSLFSVCATSAHRLACRSRPGLMGPWEVAAGGGLSTVSLPVLIPNPLRAGSTQPGPWW